MAGVDYFNHHDFEPLPDVPTGSPRLAPWPLGAPREAEFQYDLPERHTCYDARDQHDWTYDPPQKPQVPASPDSVAEDLTFLESYPPGNASISFPDGHGSHATIENLNMDIIEGSSLLLPHAFEAGRSGPRLFLEMLSSATAPALIRYLYTNTYAPADFYDDVPTSLLLHCQMYRIADTFDLDDLKTQAYVNVLRQCEFGCSSADKPINLCAALQYAYEHLTNHEVLIDAIVNYCVECFLRHRLADDKEFSQLVYNVRQFAQDLNNNVRNRGFEAEASQAIIQMQSKMHVPDTYASREDLPKSRIEDIVFQFHGGDEPESPRKKQKCAVREQDETTDLFRSPDSSLAFLKQEDDSIPMPMSNRYHKLPIQPVPLKVEPQEQENEQYRKIELQAVMPGTEAALKYLSALTVAREMRDAARLAALTESKTKTIPDPPEIAAPQPNDDSEYELVAGPGQVEALSSGEESGLSDDDFEDVPLLDRAQQPGRANLTKAQSTAPESNEASSDSEWSMV